MIRRSTPCCSTGRARLIGTPTGVIEWNDGIRHTWTAKEGLPDASVEDLFEDSRQRLWVTTRGGLALIDRQKRTVQRDTSFPALSIAEDRHGTLWLGGLGRLFERQVNGQITPHDMWEPEAGSIRATLFDREGHLWLGIDGGEGGLVRLRKHTVRVLTKDDGLPCEGIGPVLPTADGTVWVGNSCELGGISAVVNGRVQSTILRPGGILSLLEDRNGQLWAASHHSELFRLEGRRLVQQPGPVGEQPGALAVMSADSEGAIWLGGDRGLYRFQSGTWTAYHADDGLLGDQIRTIVPDKEGGLWIGTVRRHQPLSQRRLYQHHSGEWLEPGAVRAIHPDGEGAVLDWNLRRWPEPSQKRSDLPFGVQGGALDLRFIASSKTRRVSSGCPAIEAFAASVGAT